MIWRAGAFSNKPCWAEREGAESFFLATRLLNETDERLKQISHPLCSPYLSSGLPDRSRHGPQSLPGFRDMLGVSSIENKTASGLEIFPDSRTADGSFVLSTARCH